MSAVAIRFTTVNQGDVKVTNGNTPEQAVILHTDDKGRTWKKLSTGSGAQLYYGSSKSDRKPLDKHVGSQTFHLETGITSGAVLKKKIGSGPWVTIGRVAR